MCTKIDNENQTSYDTWQSNEPDSNPPIELENRPSPDDCFPLGT